MKKYDLTIIELDGVSCDIPVFKARVWLEHTNADGGRNVLASNPDYLIEEIIEAIEND